MNVKEYETVAVQEKKKEKKKRGENSRGRVTVILKV